MDCRMDWVKELKEFPTSQGKHHPGCRVGTAGSFYCMANSSSSSKFEFENSDQTLKIKMKNDVPPRKSSGRAKPVGFSFTLPS